MTVNRRSFLLGTAAAGLGAGVAAALPADASPTAAGPGAVAEGPLAHVYGRLGAPRGRALGLSGSGTGARTVTWLTTGDTVPSVVQWGVVPEGAPPGQVRTGAYLTQTAAGTSSTAPGGYFEDDDGTVTPVDGEYPVQVHRAEIAGLPAGSAVCYRVGDGAQWSPVEVTRTAPADGAFVLGHVGDHGVSVASRRTTATLLQRRPDALVLAGDISYANGFQPRWDEWAGQAEPLTSAVPLLPAPGNHEAKDYNGGTYRTRFATPGGGRNWYTTDLGRAHLFVGTAGCFLSEQEPSSAFDLVADELVGLERSLALAAARRAAGDIDFIVVAQHFPLYTNHRTRGPFSPELVIAQEHVLQRYQVDLVLVGHDHMYQRSLPMAYGEPVDVGGYVQVVAGAGGQGLYDFADPDGPDWGDWCAAWKREFSFAEHRIERGVLTTTAYGWDDEQARVDDVNANAVDPALAPRVIDTVRLRRKDDVLVRAAAAQLPRGPGALLAGVPEARGVVVRNLAEDCTRHH